MVTIHDFDDNRAFVDLVINDTELLRAEFDALVVRCPGRGMWGQSTAMDHPPEADTPTTG